MMTRLTFRSAVAASCLTLAALAPAALAHPDATQHPPQPARGPGSGPGADSAPAAPNLETLLSTALTGVENTEVIVSRVTIPPNTSLPKHWHPGEEFAYVLEGSVTLWREGAGEIVGKPGDVVMVPLKQVHTAITKEEGATILVFRVHQKGQPERVLVE
jgi:quercetin dioxygenase-like cupin family protein